MNANQMISRLERIEVSAKRDPVERRMAQGERMSLIMATRSHDGRVIAEAMDEARRVSEMWGFGLR